MLRSTGRSASRDERIGNDRLFENGDARGESGRSLDDRGDSK